MEEIRQEARTDIQGIFHMMDERTHCHWMAKPKNGALETEIAKAKWLELGSAPGATTDMLGPCERCWGDFFYQGGCGSGSARAMMCGLVRGCCFSRGPWTQYEVQLPSELPE